MDTLQTKHHLETSCQTHLKKILAGHKWETEQCKGATATPLNSDEQCIEKLDDISEGPLDVQQQQQLQKKFGFSHHQAIGELLFVAVTCHPDLMHAIIKLSQCSNNPDEMHCGALKNVFCYVRSTLNDAITCWQQQPCDDLPDQPLPTLPINNYEMNDIPHHPTLPTAFTDSDRAGNVEYQKSVTGHVVHMAGAQ